MEPWEGRGRIIGVTFDIADHADFVQLHLANDPTWWEIEVPESGEDETPEPVDPSPEWEEPEPESDMNDDADEDEEMNDKEIEEIKEVVAPQNNVSKDIVDRLYTFFPALSRMMKKHKLGLLIYFLLVLYSSFF